MTEEAKRRLFRMPQGGGHFMARSVFCLVAGAAVRRAGFRRGGHVYQASTA